MIKPVGFNELPSDISLFGKLPLDITNIIYSYIRYDVMVSMWLHNYDIKHILNVITGGDGKIGYLMYPEFIVASIAQTFPEKKHNISEYFYYNKERIDGVIFRWYEEGENMNHESLINDIVRMIYTEPNLHKLHGLIGGYIILYNRAIHFTEFDSDSDYENEVMQTSEEEDTQLNENLINQPIRNEIESEVEEHLAYMEKMLEAEPKQEYYEEYGIGNSTMDYFDSDFAGGYNSY